MVYCSMDTIVCEVLVEMKKQSNWHTIPMTMYDTSFIINNLNFGQYQVVGNIFHPRAYAIDDWVGTMKYTSMLLACSI